MPVPNFVPFSLLKDMTTQLVIQGLEAQVDDKELRRRFQIRIWSVAKSTFKKSGREKYTREQRAYLLAYFELMLSESRVAFEE